MNFALHGQFASAKEAHEKIDEATIPVAIRSMLHLAVHALGACPSVMIQAEGNLAAEMTGRRDTMLQLSVRAGNSEVVR